MNSSPHAVIIPSPSLFSSIPLSPLPLTPPPPPLSQVILFGSKDAVNRSLQRAEGYRKQLLERGVVLVPVFKEEGGRGGAQGSKGFGAAKKAANETTSLVSEGMVSLYSLRSWSQMIQIVALQCSTASVYHYHHRATTHAPCYPPLPSPHL